MVFLKYNWEDIELQYVKGILDEEGKLYFPKKIELAKMHGCDPEYLRSYARRGDWDNKRKAYLLKIELNEGEISIEDPQKELENFNVKCYQVASNVLDIIRRQLLNTSKNQNLEELSTMIKLLEKIQLIGKNSFTDMKDEFDSAKSEFERLMKKLKEDEKAEKSPPEPLPVITVADL